MMTQQTRTFGLLLAALRRLTDQGVLVVSFQELHDITGLPERHLSSALTALTNRRILEQVSYSKEGDIAARTYRIAA